jgi:hypothetical protein
MDDFMLLYRMCTSVVLYCYVHTISLSSMETLISAYMCILYIYIYTHTHVYIYIHAFMYTHIHVYISKM